MIDLHTHTILSDGELIPSELVRRAHVAGYRAIGITDHVDHSNIDQVISGLVRVAEILNRYWDIYVIPGVEITHVPVEAFRELVSHARGKGAKIVIGHGESPVEPVISGTNAAAIETGVDILAHPGAISEEEASRAAAKGVYLEITARAGHSDTNAHVLKTALTAGANMILNSDAHAPDDILTPHEIDKILSLITDKEEVRSAISRSSVELLERIKQA